MTSRTAARRAGREEEVRFAEASYKLPNDILVGKDVLELVTTAMHVDPITVYREYIQNAADAIDEARRCGMLSPGALGRVKIDVDPTSRSVRIRDNGLGLKWSRFVQSLTTIGASRKRGTQSRGFRGVGRLSGLGYAQELIFRSRVAGEELVSELRWDCRLLKEALRNNTATDTGVSELIRSIVTVSRRKGHDYPERFFEVELKGIVRLGSDRLLNATTIAEYLSQVAPVPFAADFRFAAEITTALRRVTLLTELELYVSGVNGPIRRPHRNCFTVDGKRENSFETLDIFEIPSLDGQLAAIGWVLHHGYDGALPAASLIRGLRLRCGNLQVGDHALLEGLFPESRFNAWSVGELHVIDGRILPNARRDNFEQNTHFNNLLNHITPVARNIARHCRVSSRKRHLLRQFAIEEKNVRDRLAIAAQGALKPAQRASSARVIQEIIHRMERICSASDLLGDNRSHLESTLTELKAEFQRMNANPPKKSPLGHLPIAKRRMYEHLFELVYECSANRAAAKTLIDRILVKLQAT
jgi:Histidine kinase-, DNA gyrase B-, and HSP90-like ATPase